VTAGLDDQVRLMEAHWFMSYPYDVFRRLRNEAPVYYSERDGIWAITKYDDIRNISKSPELFANGYHVFSPAAQIVPDEEQDGEGPLPPRAEARRRSQLGPGGKDSIIFADGGRHAFLRRVAGYAFTPKAVARVESEVERLTKQMFAEIEPEVEVDFVDAVAAPIPVIMIARLLGVPDEDVDRFRRWSDALVELSNEDLTAEGALQDRVGRVQDFSDYFKAEFEDRKRNPRDDLLTALGEAKFEGEALSMDELIRMTMILLIAGNETTRSLLSGTGRLLCEHPGQRDILRNSPELLGPAVEELLRVVSPVTHMCRTALRDTEIRGQKIARGDYLCLLYPAANRDEEIWDRSEELDVTRSPDPAHVAFGFAEHFCLGASLARREARIVISGLIDSFSSWDITGEVTRSANHMTPGITAMPVVFHR
jgi:cytochrome P450